MITQQVAIIHGVLVLPPTLTIILLILRFFFGVHRIKVFHALIPALTVFVPGAILGYFMHLAVLLSYLGG